jgi:hypothetical protein
MSEEKKDPWLNHLALTTIVFAVCATLSTFKGGSFSTRSVISQAQASDQWAFFQAKAIKGDLYQVQHEALQTTLDALPANAPQAQRDVYVNKIAEYEKKIAKYKQEKSDIQRSAQAFEAQRDAAQHQGRPFGVAVIFLQVAILISSIAGLFKQRSIWFTALPIGLIGLVYFADGFFLFF